MPLTADQKHCFSTSRRWRDFRALFPSTEAALGGYLAAIEETAIPAAFTHELEWRYIFHNRESQRKQVFALLLLPLGHLQTHHAEFRFRTRHGLSAPEARRLMLGRALGACVYYLCFIGLILAGVGILIAVVTQLFSGATLPLSLLVAGLVILMAILLVAAARSRSLGLFGPVRLIARDAFDLVSIRRIKASDPTPADVTAVIAGGK